MRRALLALPLLSLMALSAPSMAETTYPSRPVTLVVPFAPGGPTDTTGRLLAETLSQRLGQRFVVENIGGAGSTIGAARVARSAPDGYTLLINHLALPGGAALHARLPYDTATAFAPIGMVNYGPLVLTARRDIEAADTRAFLDWMRARGPSLNKGHAGIGSAVHLCSLLIQHRLGVSFNDIAYRGTAPALADMLAGRVDVVCDLSTTAIPQVRAGNIRAFAVTTRQRLATLPDVPTLHESGFEGFDLVLWNGLYAPAGTPAPVIARLNAALREALAEPAMRERFARFGTEIFPPEMQTPEVAGARLQQEIRAIGEAVRAMGLQPQG
jgi:tripartite-type tricarboxylate transporter receptor subunit TctC